MDKKQQASVSKSLNSEDSTHSSPKEWHSSATKDLRSNIIKKL